MEHYYELKQKYTQKMDKRKEKIKEDYSLTTREKRARIMRLIPSCINCNKSGGTRFEEKNGTLKAVCAATPPCTLNINITRKLYDNALDLELKNDKAIENLKLRIIMIKLDYLFGINTTKEETVDRFTELKTELAQLTQNQMLLYKKFGDILTGVNREPLLYDTEVDLVNEIDELKQIYAAYLADETNTAYLKTMVEKYVSTIKPLVEKNQQLKYGYYAVESIISNTAMDGFEYRLMATPYQVAQLEQERK